MVEKFVNVFLILVFISNIMESQTISSTTGSTIETSTTDSTTETSTTDSTTETSTTDQRTYYSMYTSCNQYATWNNGGCYPYTSTSSTSYGPIVFQQLEYFSSTCYTNQDLVNNCYNCQTNVTNNPSVSTTSCDTMTMSSYMYQTTQCDTYSSNYLTCYPVINYEYSASWDRQWHCSEGGKWYVRCNDCQYYQRIYFSFSPYCSPYSTYSSYINSWSTSYTWSNNCPYSTSISYYSKCSVIEDSATTPASATPSNTASPCFPTYCLNNGTCRTEGCPSDTFPCCSCPVGYVGKQCETITTARPIPTTPVSSRRASYTISTPNIIPTTTEAITTTPVSSRRASYTISTPNIIPTTTEAITTTPVSSRRASYTISTPNIIPTTTEAITTTSTIDRTTTAPLCYPGFCQNNGTCVTRGCPSGYSSCCSCLADYLGERCNITRSSVVQTTLKSLLQFSDDLLDPSTELYKNYSQTFITLWYNVTVTAYAMLYGDTDVISIKIQVTGFKRGSTMVQMAVSVAVNPKYAHAVKTIVNPSEDTFKQALTSQCNAGSSCTSFKLDTNYTSMIVNPNLCKENTLNLCSSSAICNFYGGVNYTCVCPVGYRDDSLMYGGRAGSTCTEKCTDDRCGGKGQCLEVANAQVQCNWCSGKNCEVDKVYIIGASVSVGLLLIIIVAGLVLWRICRRKREKQAF